MHVLENESIRLEVSSLGAELKSVIAYNKERLWPGKEPWQRSSPVLFPVVGRCFEDKLRINGQRLSMKQHGFARDMEFDVVERLDGLRLVLKDTEESRKNYPFAFELSIGYTLLSDGFTVEYDILNPNGKALPFSIGAHPGFLLDDAEWADYRLEFNVKEDADRHLLRDGCFDKRKEASLVEGVLALKPQEFDKDAIVYMNLESDEVALKQGNKTVLKIEFEGFPHFGIWTKAGCRDFICLEPWLGYADYIGFNQSIESKAGIQILEPGEKKSLKWSVRF